MKRAVSLIPILLLLAIAAPASALDAYQDRRGILVGVNLGGGPGSANVDNPIELTGLDDHRQIGFQLGAEIGGGMSERITGTLGFNWWIRTISINQRSLDHHQLSILPTARLFVIDGLYGMAGAGLAYAAFDAERAGATLTRYREMGFAAKVGAGYEFFLNGTVAAGLEANYTRHFYSASDFDTVNALVTVRWY